MRTYISDSEASMMIDRYDKGETLKEIAQASRIVSQGELAMSMALAKRRSGW